MLASLDFAQAAVFPGPLLNEDRSGHTATSIGFMALDNSHLKSFTYQNEGAADAIVLMNRAGPLGYHPGPEHVRHGERRLGAAFCRRQLPAAADGFLE
jgi:hypothetical protein